jgi:hypothetical protein
LLICFNSLQKKLRAFKPREIFPKRRDLCGSILKAMLELSAWQLEINESSLSSSLMRTIKELIACNSVVNKCCKKIYGLKFWVCEYQKTKNRASGGVL